jgi:hypothetical protein
MHATQRCLRSTTPEVNFSEAEGRYKKYRTKASYADCNNPRHLALRGFDLALDRELVNIAWKRDRLTFDDPISGFYWTLGRHHYACYQRSCDQGARSQAWSAARAALNWSKQLRQGGWQ